MIGLLATTAVWICLGFKSFSNPVVDYIGYSVKYLFMFIPTFNFGRAIMAIAQVMAIVPHQLCLQTISFVEPFNSISYLTFYHFYLDTTWK